MENKYIIANGLRALSHSEDERRQKESGRRLFLVAALGACLLVTPAHAEGDIAPGGLTFRDFGSGDRGASLNRDDHQREGGPNQVTSRVVTIDNDKGLARIAFDSIKVEVAIPLGWQATEDWERGVAYSSDRRYRLIIWRVSFPFEGVRDAEHYAATKVGTIQANKRGVRANARKLSDGTFLTVYENVPPGPGDSERRTVFDLVQAKPGDPKEGVLMTLGVPANDTDRGLKLMALLKQSLRVAW